MNKDFIYNRIYSVSMVVMIISIALLVFVQNSNIAIGQSVGSQREAQGRLYVYEVADGQNGGDPYYVSKGTAEVVGEPILMKIPLVDVWLGALQNGIGVSVLIGLPLLMLLINVAMQMGHKLLSIIQMFRRRALQRKVVQRKRNEEKVVQDESAEEVYAYEEVQEVEEKETRSRIEYVTVLKPYSMRSGYGM